MHYLGFCQPGTPFYDIATTAVEDLPEVTDELPDGWTRGFDADWCYVRRCRPDIPQQGWKIHVSTTPEHVGTIVAAVRDYCLPRGIMFKFLRSRWVLLRRNGKYGDRGSSGKFVTIFPHDEAELARTLADLDATLGRLPGPAILSDLRYRSGPLYVRYGGFVARTMRTESGGVVHVISDPSGREVPDLRKPGFHVPDWVPVPSCLRESLDARRSGTLDGFPFRATRALHFSNGGGVYLATHLATGAEVLLKEARPLAGLDESGQDAVARLAREHWAMRQLAGLACVPAVIDYRKGHEHYFLAREYVPGTSFLRLAAERNPVLNPHSGLSAAQYSGWALDLLDRIAAGLAEMHARGVVFGDVHPNNVLVRPDGTVCFIDFETASAVADDAPQRIGAPGFRAPPTHRGVAADRYGMGCLRISAFLPLTVTMAWGPDKLEMLLRMIADRFDLPAGFAAAVRADLAPPRAAAGRAGGAVVASGAAGGAGGRDERPAPALDAEDWAGVRRAVLAHLAASADPAREDRLLPGDVTQFRAPGGGVTFVAGAAGVLWTLRGLGATVPPEWIDWFVQAAERLADPPPGFGDGAAGVALVLDQIGRHERAADLLLRAARHPWLDARASLMSGAPGVGLVALELHGADPSGRWLDLAGQMADRCAQPPDTGGPGGLLHGPAGAALLHLRLSAATGDEALLRRAADLARADLDALGWPGAPSPGRPGWSSATLAAGGAGTAMLLTDLAAACRDPDLRAAGTALTAALRAGPVGGAGLLTGLSGALLARRYTGGRTAQIDRELAGQAAALRLHAVPQPGGLAFLGEHALRLSCDWGTGSVGVLSALDAAIGSGDVIFPFFGAKAP